MVGYNMSDWTDGYRDHLPAKGTNKRRHSNKDRGCIDEQGYEYAFIEQCCREKNRIVPVNKSVKFI